MLLLVLEACTLQSLLEALLQGTEIIVGRMVIPLHEGHEVATGVGILLLAAHLLLALCIVAEA